MLTDSNKIRMLLACSGLMVIAVTLYGLSLIILPVYIFKKAKESDWKLRKACFWMSLIACK